MYFQVGIDWSDLIFLFVTITSFGLLTSSTLLDRLKRPFLKYRIFLFRKNSGQVSVQTHDCCGHDIGAETYGRITFLVNRRVKRGQIAA